MNNITALSRKDPKGAALVLPDRASRARMRNANIEEFKTRANRIKSFNLRKQILLPKIRMALRQ